MSLLILCFCAAASAALLPAAACKIDIERAMGTWYVQRAIPAIGALEKSAHNGVEEYVWDAENECIDVTYTFNAGSLEGPTRTVRQRGWMQDDLGTTWKISPLIGGIRLPVKLPFIIIDIDDKDYSYLTCSGGLDSWLYIMTREPKPTDETLAALEKAVEAIGFDASKLLPMPRGEVEEFTSTT